MTEHLSIYLDESGDLGFNFEKQRTTKHFMITLLVCKDRGTNRLIEQAVAKTLRHKVNHKAKTPKQELKGTTTTLATKAYFYRHLEKSQNWSVYSVILDKPKLIKQLGSVPIQANLYNHLARTIMARVNFGHTASLVRLIVDRSKNRHEIKAFNHALTHHLMAFLPLDTRLSIDHLTSQESRGLQAADLFSWGLFKKYEDHCRAWYSYYQARIEAEVYLDENGEDGPYLAHFR